ncbi:hypothetical protein J437_LFUL008731, partial [Ladona fulva]
MACRRFIRKTIQSDLLSPALVLRHIMPHSAKLVTFDVVDFFTSIPPEEAQKIVIQFLVDSDIPTDIVNDIAKLLQICLKQNYFLFNGIFYQQECGLAM